MVLKNKRVVVMLVIITLLLLIPFIAMQFTDEVNWGLFDFVVAAVLLFGTGLIGELVLRNVRKMKYRIILCTVILVVLIIVWAELAVGIFGSVFSGN